MAPRRPPGDLNKSTWPSSLATVSTPLTTFTLPPPSPKLPCFIHPFRVSFTSPSASLASTHAPPLPLRILISLLVRLFPFSALYPFQTLLDSLSLRSTTLSVRLLPDRSDKSSRSDKSICYRLLDTTTTATGRQRNNNRQLATVFFPCSTLRHQPSTTGLPVPRSAHQGHGERLDKST
ncbi:hypothetical protein NUW54_g10559 [Trametes sanguinea]|uniref:Uncharacterized protein n=1 Tax=Trametes sanguinea TaxID=158606 RepID=A0ACC1NXT6_9APHY|nr:hypothetical protein NUW54_g10559 [Trametes sanguinea]